MSGSFSRDTYYLPQTFTTDKTLVIVEDPGGTNEATITLTVDSSYTYYLHNDSSYNGTKVGLYYALEDALNNGTNTWVTVTGTVTNTYAFSVSDPSTSSAVTNAGLTLTATAATYSFRYDWTGGGTIDARLLGYKDAAPGADTDSATSGADEVIISAHTVRGRFVTFDLGDGAAQSKKPFPRKIVQRSSERVSDSITTNWGEELDRVLTYQDVWPALVDPDRAGDTGYASVMGLGGGDKNNTWYLVWDALTDGDEVIIVHNSVSDHQIDANDYEVVKLAEDLTWEQFQIETRTGADLRDIRFRVAVLNGTYDH